jgi:nitroreductase
MPDSALASGNMMLAAHSLGIGSCWLNQLPGLTHMPLIRELLTDLDVPQTILYMVLLLWVMQQRNPNQLCHAKMSYALFVSCIIEHR